MSFRPKIRWSSLRLASRTYRTCDPVWRAEVRFTSYKQRSIPIVHGRVTRISADRITDSKTGFPYYLADVAVDPVELAAAPQIALYPGMPASVMIVTEERTALDYVLGPLVVSFHSAFRQ
ncbi:HlyD family secretion protein, partial [Mesorhizobium sp. M7A.F.Ca.CA.004.06.2.1]|uniref:HlyD family secretion protein n=1 Tax=unclassified Mesorhizobium TaxID=325217 RepID=UPI0032AEF504